MSYMKEWLHTHCCVCAKELTPAQITEADGSVLNSCSPECHANYVAGYVGEFYNVEDAYP